MVHIIGEHTLFPLLKRLYKIKVNGLEKISSNKNYIFAMNHTGWLDVFLAMLIIYPHTKRPLSVIIFHKFYDFPLLNLVFRNWQAIRLSPVESERKNSLIEAKALFDNGNNILIYPEGRHDGGPINTLYRGQTGVVRLAIECKRPIIPIGSKGVFNAWRMDPNFPHRFFSILFFDFSKPIEFNFGNEFKLYKFCNLNINKQTEKNRKIFRKLTDNLMDEISILSGEPNRHLE